MKPYSEITADTGIPKSTLERYIKELDEAGFIERRQALYSRTSANGEFVVKKGAYINITDKLLAHLKDAKKQDDQKRKEQDEDIHKNTPDKQVKQHDIKVEKQPECSENNNNEGIEPPKIRGLYISDLFSSSFVNNIIFKNSNPSVDKHTHHRLNSQFTAIRQLLFTEIKEEIPEDIKKQVAGTFFNLTYKHKVNFSSPKQVVAEYLFALLNIEFYMPHIQCIKHRNNILAKILRTNNWGTPKGFYNHFYLGQNFKDKLALREQQWQEEKEAEINPTKISKNEISSGFDTSSDIIDERLVKLEAKIYEKGCLIKKLTESIYQESSEEIILSLREKIQKLRKELGGLWHEQFLIEQEVEKEESYNNTQLCA
ncbi:hypothetical protein [Legionella israelensis]|uniref:hypothetical protein n=1 Tax=Legionella israelensis TaxID=454 RepID=UPI001FD320B5|nr:hypothetical protein [Legionella israelensis]